MGWSIGYFSEVMMISNYEFKYECTYTVTANCKDGKCCSKTVTVTCDYHARDTVEFWDNPTKGFGHAGRNDFWGLWGWYDQMWITDRLVRACFPSGKGFLLTANSSETKTKNIPCD